MHSHRSTYTTWTFVADAPRYYDLTKTEEENDHLGHVWFDQSNASSSFQPTTQHRNESTPERNKQDTTPIGLYHDDDTLPYDERQVNYTTNVYQYSPSHRQPITKRRDIKTELSRTRQELMQHLQGGSTVEDTDLEDTPNEHSLTEHLMTPPRHYETSISLSNGEQNQNSSSVMDDMNPLLTNNEDDEQPQQQQQQQSHQEDNLDDDGRRLIKLPLLGRVIISPKAAEPTPSLHTHPILSPILGRNPYINWEAEVQSSPLPPLPALADKHPSSSNVVRHGKPHFSSYHSPPNHNEETEQHQSPVDSHKPLSPSLLPRKRLYSDEPNDDSTQPALKKRPASPPHHQHKLSPALEEQQQQQSLSPPPFSSSSSPLLELIARVKAQKRPPPLSPLMQVINHVKSFKRKYNTTTTATRPNSQSWKIESVMERAKRVMKETRAISLQWNLPELKQQLHHHHHHHRRRTTMTSIPPIKKHDRRTLGSIPLEENGIDDDLMDSENEQQQQQQQHRSGSVSHSFVSRYLPVALTVPRSPKFSSDKRSRRW